MNISKLIKRKLIFFSIVIWLLTGAFAYSQSSESVYAYPRIDNLHIRDIQFKQFQDDVEFSYRRMASLEITSQSFLSLAEELTIFSYQIKEHDTILALAARCNIHYAAISTLNRLAHPSSLIPGSVILLPSIPGIFVPEEPQNDVERLILSSRDLQNGVPIKIRKNGLQLSYIFLPGADFSQTERVFYLYDTFRFPLKDFRLTSSFGERISPITGNPSFHRGLDLAAAIGTDVYASRAGTVAESGDNTVYGKYIIINHGEGWQSLYGHLSEILIPLQSAVQSGTLIGKVGSTGLSTGPHLHFELRQNGEAHDPEKYFSIQGIQP